VNFDPSFPSYRSVRNKFKEAFKEGFNLVGLAGFFAASAATLNPIPLLVGVAAEIAYLLFVPDTKWYEKRLEHRFDAEVIKRREDLKAKIFPMVRLDVQDRFRRLETARAQIGQNASKEEHWFLEAMRKLDFLLEKYLQFAAKEAEFSSYLQSLYAEIYPQLDNSARRNLKPPKPPRRQNANTYRLNPRSGVLEPSSEPVDDSINPTEEWTASTVEAIQKFYADEVKSLEEKIGTEQVLATRNILEKRKEVVSRREQFVGRIGEILDNLGHQMQLMGETFGLINDEIRARSPEQVLSDIDDVVDQTTSLTQALEEITPIETLVASNSE